MLRNATYARHNRGGLFFFGVRLAVATACLIILGAMWIAVRSDEIPSFDRVGFELLAVAPSGWIATQAPLMVKIGELAIALALMASVGVLLWMRKWRNICVLLVGTILVDLSAHALKTSVARLRPIDGVVYRGGFSFPSTTAALCVSLGIVALMLAMVVEDRRWRAAIIASGWALAFTLGAVMVALRVHYVSDVIAGWALAGGLFCLCDALIMIAIAGIWRIRSPQRSELTN